MGGEPPILETHVISDACFPLTLGKFELDCELFNHEATEEFKSSFMKISTIVPNWFKTIL